MAGGHAWQGGMHSKGACLARGACMQERRPLKRMLCSLLECILVLNWLSKRKFLRRVLNGKF